MMIGLPSVVAQTVYLVALGALVPMGLRGARWVLRAPRLGAGLWQALSVAWIGAVVILGLTLAQPVLDRVAWPQDATQGVTAPQAIAALIGFSLAGATIARTGYVVTRELLWARRRRRSHLLALAFAGEPADALGATVVEHGIPAVYSLPAPDQRHAVVISTAALELLSEEELAAVVAHERGHLSHHHHLLTAVAGALDLALPGVPLLRSAHREIEILAEMAADDHARQNHGGEVLAAALLALTTAPTPEHALGASGHTVTSRLQRMLAATPPLARPTRFVTITSAAAAVTLPVGLSCTTMFAAATVIVGHLVGA
jgi:Zn-dependent protease with chaperone function